MSKEAYCRDMLGQGLCGSGEILAVVDRDATLESPCFFPLLCLDDQSPLPLYRWSFQLSACHQHFILLELCGEVNWGFEAMVEQSLARQQRQDQYLQQR